RTASTGCAATARAAPRRRGGWRNAGPTRHRKARPPRAPPADADAAPSPPDGGGSPGSLLALAYPDRVARNRGAGGAFLLANGRGAQLDPASALAREPFVAVAELTGTAAQSRILLAAPIALHEIEVRFAA